MKELLNSFVSKIELHFKDAKTGRQKREFTHGTVYLRPDAGSGIQGTTDPEVTHLINKGPINNMGRDWRPRFPLLLSKSDSMP